MNIQKFIEIEEKYNLYEKKINDCPYWIFARFELWNYNICKTQLDLGNRNSSIKFHFWKRLINTLKSLISIIKSPRNPDILVLNHERRILSDGYYNCVYTDEITSEFDFTANIEEPFEEGHFTPTKTKNLIYSDLINVLLSIYRKMSFFSMQKIKQKLIIQLQKPLSELSEAYNWKFKNELYTTIANMIISYKLHKYLYKKLLKHISPKLILEVVYYNPSRMIINSVAKELNIKTIELQHGTMYNDHAAYHYSQNLKKLNEFPDDIFLFSDFWKKNITVPLSQNHLHSIGFPLFDKNRKSYPPKTNIDKKAVLFISQGTIGLQLSKLAIKLAEQDKSKNYKIIYKLHPSEYSDWQIKYSELSKSDIEVIDKRNCIYEYFAQSDYVVGVYSTAIFEAIGFGLKALIYKVGHYDVMSDLINDGYATLIDSPEELLHELNLINKTCPSEKLWQPNAFNNMKNKINDLLKI